MSSWLNYYDWVLGPDGPKPPPDEEILEDDELLDDFIEQWKDSFKQDKKTKRNTKHFEIE